MFRKNTAGQFIHFQGEFFYRRDYKRRDVDGETLH